MPKTSTDDDVPDDEHYYPDEGGNLIEIESNGDITDHGIVWRSGTKADSPDPTAEGDIYAGYGRFNSIVSNMVNADGVLHFIAGYGSPFLSANNLPGQSIQAPIYFLSNFHRLQWGNALA